MIGSAYYWNAFERIGALRLYRASDLRVPAWPSGARILCDGGEPSFLIPTRYPESHTQHVDDLARASLTRWIPLASNSWAGVGRRVWISDVGEYPMLETPQLQQTIAARVERAE